MQQKEATGHSKLEHKSSRNKEKGKDNAFRSEFGIALETLNLIKGKSDESGYRLITLTELLSSKGVEDNAPLKKKSTKKIPNKSSKTSKKKSK